MRIFSRGMPKKVEKNAENYKKDYSIHLYTILNEVVIVHILNFITISRGEHFKSNRLLSYETLRAGRESFQAVPE